MKPSVLLIPGIGNSGPKHWQSHWEAMHSHTTRVQQSDWDNPDCDTWVEQLELAVRAAPVPPVLVAHSLGCLVVCSWASKSNLPIKAALLVAVPDPLGPLFPKAANGFKNLPTQIGQRRLMMVSSNDDPFSTPLYTQQRVTTWNTEHIALGAKGHINAASGLGDWSYGWQLVEKLLSE